MTIGSHHLVLVALSTGCLGPQVSDEAIATSDIFPPGAVVPRADDDPVIAAQLELLDGVDATVPLIGGFAAGHPTRTWDFGPAPAIAAPLFVLAQRSGSGELEPIAHNTIIDAIPGDPGYSPFWAVFMVEVTDRYAGELITSFAAVGAAVDAGLVLSPVSTDIAVNCPAVAPDVTVDVGTGQPLPATSRFYYRGSTIPYFDLGPMPIDADRVTVPEQRHYVLRREGAEPLSEPIRGVDLVGDGDLVDSNDVYERAADDPDRSPLCRTVAVAVVAETASIDTSRDDEVADLRAASQLFSPGPVPNVVTAVAVGDELRNCPAQRMAGAL